MSIKILTTTACAAVLGLASVNTQAASIWLEPVSQDILPGGTANLELWADASDVGGFLGGGLDVFYDNTLLVYNEDFAFDPSFPTDVDLSRPGTNGIPDNCAVDPTASGCSVPGEINGIAFGTFLDEGLAGAGPTLVGTLSFTGSDLFDIGMTTSLTMADNDLPAGPFIATDFTNLAGLVDYTGATVNAVPIPAAVWLMFGGLGMLVGVARRRKA